MLAPLYGFATIVHVTLAFRTGTDTRSHAHPIASRCDSQDTVKYDL